MTSQEQPSPSSPEEKPKPLWTVRDVATFFDVSHTLIYELAAARKIPCGKIGGTLRFDQAEIKAWWKIRKRG